MSVEDIEKRMYGTNDFQRLPHIEKQYGGLWFRCKSRGFFVHVSMAREADGLDWFRVQILRRSKLPSFDDVNYVRHLAFDPKVRVIMDFPPGREYFQTRRDNVVSLYGCPMMALPVFKNPLTQVAI